ncbi:MAG: [FeFe] hydrogenase H-cluster radical SAM maturase HydE [Candidatus Aenigmarchaeota archaeon]|nr:[FeFe] hydrogenase H-cluster radical SAM maturase HydE [Candidatus Aenigmarchaeota archaeon]
MCYAIPGKILELRDNIAVVDYFGEHRNVLNDFTDVQIGDYIYAQGGILVQKIPKQDAILILKEWEERFFQLKKLDLKISRIKEEVGIEDNKFIKIIEKTREGISLKRDEVLRLLKTNDKKELNLLFKTANKLRQKHLKNSCCVHGIIEFSNHCRNDCLYCGIRKSNKKLKRYRMDVDEIVKVASFAVNRLGFKALVLQSGEDFWYTTEKLIEMIKKIKEKCGVLLFMSIGERSFDCYKRMYEAGARGVLFRFETSNPRLYKKLHRGPKLKFQNRIKLLRYMSKLGYIIATGSLIGLPGQTEEDLMNDILLTKSLNAEMYSFGPLIPHSETPLANASLENINTVLKVLAVSRLIDPKAKILVTTALETLDKENGRKLGLLSGANSLMINVTPTKYKNLYSIYPNKAGNEREIEDDIEKTLNLLYSLGRAPTDLGI